MLRWEDWLGEAEEEFRSAEVLLEGARFSWCCFTCQQSAEKSLKALLDRQGAAVLSHNLNELAREVDGHDPLPAEIFEACRRLNHYYIPTRYPDAFPSGVPAHQYGQPEAEKALEDARLVLDLARTRLSPSS